MQCVFRDIVVLNDEVGRQKESNFMRGLSLKKILICSPSILYFNVSFPWI